MEASIIITTRDRAAYLHETLRSLRDVVRPDGLGVELLVVDNGSTDETEEVVRSIELGSIAVRYVFECQRGQCFARNRGLAETMGDIILFTDDDVRLPLNWIAGMCHSLVDHAPCAIAGGVTLAPHLQRPWMTKLHRSWLAATEWLDRDQPQGMVGANMGFCRAVLRRVPNFDTELGPGALGFGDEQLFALQLRKAGYHIVGNQHISVEHHFDPARLLRSSWIDAAIKRGRSQAYRGHHWEHWGSRGLRPRLMKATLSLAAWRSRHLGTASLEGASERELELEFECALLRAHLKEKLRPRNYDFRGAIKRRHHANEISPLYAPTTPERK